MKQRTVLQAITTVSLSYAVVLAYKCPCKKLLSCHYKEFLSSLGIALIAVSLDSK